MKIQGWLVESFGAFRNYDVRDLPGGLTVFCGPNGSGKSTLFAFLRQILFGPAGRDPLFGDHRWAGRLYCAGGDGIYTIARTADASRTSVTRPDGSEGGDADVDRLFGGSDCRAIGSLLAFDIADLQSLPAFPSSSVRDRLFPPGAGRELQSAQRAIDAIQIRKSEVAQRASRDLQNLPDAPADLQARIDRATRAAARLCQLLQSQTQARLTLDLRTRTIADLRSERTRYAALLELVPVWQELTQARRELDGIEAVDEFPADPEQRLEAALTARDSAQRTVAQLVGQTPRREPGDDADERFGTVVRQRVRLPDLTSTSEDLSAWQRRLKEAVEASRECERELEGTTRALRELELTRAEISTTLSRSEPSNIATLDEEARLVQHVRTILAALASDQTTTRRQQDQIAERSASVRDLEAQVVRMPSRAIAAIAWCAAVLGMAAAGVRHMQGDTLGPGALAAFSLVCVTLAIGQRSRRRRALDEDENRRTQLANARADLEKACQNLMHHQERATRRRFDISVDAVRLGLPPMPSDLQLKEREAELEAQRRLRLEWDKAQADLAENTSAIARAEDARRQQMQALVAAQTHERQTIQQWQQWKVHAGLADSGGTVRAAGENVPTEAELLENCRRLRIQIAEWEQNATGWNSRARASLAGGSDVETAAIAGPGGRVAVAVAEPSIESSPALQAARRRLRQCEDALAHLFAQAGVSDEAAFRSRLAAYRRRQVLHETIRACEARYNERVRREPSPDAILRELTEGHADDWRHRAERVTAELTGLDASRDECLRQLRQLDADIATASAESADLPVLEVERAGLTEDAAASLEASRTLSIAGSLLEDARRHVELDCQPPALRHASEALSAITFSKLERVRASEDQRELLVFDAKDGWKSVGQLSRGAVEQLHFSLRVGLAEDSAHCAPWLPLIMDDVLDHFDPKRSQAMARQLVDLSRRHQVFVFTRRPETRDMLRSLDPAAHVIDMQEL